jgi:tetratricopeptide (TPR) repeat protein
VARNRKVFEEAMRAGANAAWDQNWDQAIAAYQRALGEFPRDAGALTRLGLAYANVGQLEDALESYRRASELTPDDPTLHEHIGKMREQLGQEKEAAEAYLASADCYASKQQSSHLALERWQDAVRAYPDCLKAHAQLLRYYQRHGHVRQAVNECLALVRIYQAQGQTQHAIQVCQYALKLAPHDPKVLAALDELRYDKQTVVELETATSQEKPETLATREPVDTTILDFPVTPVAESRDERGSPIEIARREALTDLAESFFEEEEIAAPSAATARLRKAEVDALIGRAIDFQTRSKIDKAITSYERVLEADVDRPAVHFCLGLLYQEKTRFDDAIAQFEHTVSHAKYRLGTHFALGECFRAQGRTDKALEHFVEVLRIIDLSTVQGDQADELAQFYESLADQYSGKAKREQALEFTNSLVDFLSQKGWENQIVEARQQLDALAQEGPLFSLAEMLAVPDAGRVLESVARAQEYSSQTMFYTALEECYYALGLAPTYLPVHRQLAQVMVAMDKVNEAVSKFVVVADAYRMRGSMRSAIAIYQRALKLTPMDTKVRAKLIDLLSSYGAVDQALEHYMILADSHYHQAQMDQTRETYQEALKLTPRGSPERQWRVRILHRIGDIDMQRVDWKRAVAVYEQIRTLAPDDERARSTLMDLYYRLNRPERAIIEMDNLVRIYQESGETERVFTLIEDAVRERPDDIPLRTRLAQVHLDAGNADQALKHLDRLGDLQLEDGRYEDAQATIRAIIALQPPNVAAYQQILDQINERASS